MTSSLWTPDANVKDQDLRDSLGRNLVDDKNFLLAYGYIDKGPYQSGLQFTARNQFILKDYEYFVPNDTVSLPFITLGNWDTQDGNKFIPAGDSKARADIAGLVESVGATAPITSSGGANPVIGISAATTGAAGSMSGADKTKLDGIGAGATIVTVNVTAPITKTGTTSPTIGISAASGAAAGSMSATDKTKLDGVATGATANSTDAFLLARANHTGTQTAATISNFAATVLATVLTGLSLATSTAVAAADSILVAFGKLQAQINGHFGTGGATHPAVTTSVNGFMSAADKTKLDGVTGGAAVASVSGTAPIVSSGGTTPAISISAATGAAAGSLSAADKTKLDGIATGATANSSDATLLARANHTGTQLASTISNFAATVLATVLTGISFATSTAVTAADTILVALGKLQAQLTAHVGVGATQHPAVTTSVNGFMSAADKTKLDGVGAGATVTGVAGTAPIVSTGGAAPTISINAATTSGAGSLSASDKTKLDSLIVGLTSAIIASVTTQNSVADANILTLVVPANKFAAGSVLTADLYADISGAAAGGNLEVWIKVGAAKLHTVILTLPAGATANKGLSARFFMTQRSATTMQLTAEVVTAQDTLTPIESITTVLNGFDVTLSNTVILGWDWTVANAANIAVAHSAMLQQQR